MKTMYFFFTVMIFLVLTSITFSQNQEKFIYKDNMRINAKTNIPVAIYDIDSKIYQGNPENIAKTYLLENKKLLKMKDDLQDLEFGETKKSPAGSHVSFNQKYKGFPVFRSDIVVSINNENRVTMVMNGYMPDITIPSTQPSVISSSAIKSVKDRIKVNEKSFNMQPKTELFVFQDSLDTYHLAWKVNFISHDPRGDWQAFVDAITGEIISVEDISFRSVNGIGKVFDPDPVSALSNTSLTDNNNQDYPALAGAYKIITLYELNDPISGIYRIQGKYARSEDIESPNTACVTSSTADGFQFNRSQSGFEEVNAYYFLDKQRRYIGGLGFSPKWLGYDYIRFDAHGYLYDNSWYAPSTKHIS